MAEPIPDFSGLSALFINCSIVKEKLASHTQKLIDKVAPIMRQQGVAVDQVYVRDHTVAFGMIIDGAEEGLPDDWPAIQKKIMAADILVIGTPIWLGDKSSIATLAIERMYAYSGETNDKGQYLYYGKAGGCIVTGNEDGVKHCARDVLYALQHIGYTIPPQADCGWLGEIGPGPSYGDTEFKDQTFDPPMGFDSDFTNKNATFMAWNLMHAARMLKDNGGYPAIGNTAGSWQKVANATDTMPQGL